MAESPCKLCRLSDFPGVMNRANLRELSARPIHRKTWEIAQAYHAMTHLVDTTARARVLGIGAGQEPTGYLMTNHAEQVFMTDMYLEPGVWTSTAPNRMLTEPELGAESWVRWDPKRLVVQHMDARALRYPDNFFTGIYSSSSVEHFGTHAQIAQAMREAGRVLAPGGVLTLTTEYRLDGPAGKPGWPGVMVFTEQQLYDVLIAPTGCDLVAPLDLTMDDDTLATAYALEAYIARIRAGLPAPEPHIVVTHQGFTFTSVHIVLRKPG